MENGECGEPRGVIKNAQHILVMMSANQQLLGRIFSMHSPLIRMALTQNTLEVATIYLLKGKLGRSLGNP